MGQGVAKHALGLDPGVPVAMSELMEKSTAKIAAPLASPVGVQGMDVSGWQADPATHSVSQVNWSSQWSNGARFVYVKATEGNNFSDASRTSHLVGAKAAGLMQGAYHFALPNQSSAVSQADYFVTNGGRWTADGSTLPPLLDIENNPYGANCYNMTPAAMVTWIRDFSNRVRAQTGRLPMIYTNYYWWQECTGDSAEFGSHALHIAAYGASSPWVPGGWDDWSFWQYSDAGPFAGDSNVWNGTLASLNKFAQGSVGSTPAPVPTPSITSAADLVAADSAGILWDYPGTGTGSFGARKQIGQGWLGIRSIQVIDWNADGVLDLVAQRTVGSLSLYVGNPGGGFKAATTLAASGFDNKQVTLGYWLNASKYPQIITRSSTGVLQQWPNTAGSALGAPVQMATGWNGINLTMVDFDGDGKQDILGQYPDGSLKLNRSNGAGALVSEPRTTIASGWDAYTSVTVSREFASSGSVGLIRRTPAGALDYVPVQGNSAIGKASGIGSGWTSYLIAGGETINLLQKPATPPAPTAVAGSASAVVTVAKAASGDAANKVVVTAAPGGANCTISAGSGTCTVNGLNNGKAYTFKAMGSNAAGSSAASAASAPVVPTAPVTRLAGADRYAVSAAVSRTTFDPGVSIAYIASGADFPDALAGAAAAGKTGGPVLLAATNGINDDVSAELTRLKPQSIVVLGGTGTLTNNVVNVLKKYSPTVTRISGADRYATSATVSKATFPAGVAVAYISSGSDFPDALSGAAAAGKTAGPVMLAATNGVTTEVKAELTRLKPKKIVVLGGAGVLTNNVQNVLKKYSSNVTRLSGAERYATSAAVSKATFTPGVGVAYVSSGIVFPDALAGAAAAGKTGSPVLLASTDGISSAVKTELFRLKPKRIVILGGTGTLGNNLQAQLAAYTP